MKNYRAIDLYSGIGGWSLGLGMSGIDVIASYEWWDKANYTNKMNNKHVTTKIDIRKLNLEDLPEDIDIVVGSPPCTQFSFANRGGSGDIEDGLKDISKFLSVVDYLKPKYWAMENVPRVAGIIENEIKNDGRLAKFSHLKYSIEVVDLCEWGVPQRRQRCIVGNLDFNLLNAYKKFTSKRTLGNVIESLSKSKIIDPIYGLEIHRSNLIDHDIEEFLSPEEERMNREMKTFHPVYNNMAFPDFLNRPARTITATCTRVSRESIVIASPEQKNRFRRLTIRERGCLQGFPITYQFYGESYSQKLKMIGNAIPPLLTFYIAQAMVGIKECKLIHPSDAINVFVPPKEPPPKTLPDKIGGSYSPTRRFRAAIPNLRFKSGMRFELANTFSNSEPDWKVRFFFGNSKNIIEIELDESIFNQIKSEIKLKSVISKIIALINPIEHVISSTDSRTLQSVWTHSNQTKPHPYTIVDTIGKTSAKVKDILKKHEVFASEITKRLVAKYENQPGFHKLIKNSSSILTGFLIGSFANQIFKRSKFNSNI